MIEVDLGEVLSAIEYAWRWLGTNWLDLLKALAAPIIAVAALRVSRQQVEINASKLRLDLYDRRSEVYAAVKNLLGEFWADATVKPEGLDRFRKGTVQADFLFSDSVGIYLAQMDRKGQRLISCTAAHFRGDENRPGRPTYLQEMEHLQEWFAAQGPVAKDMFKPFLRLEQPRPRSWAHRIARSVGFRPRRSRP
ncbi:TPA: hypothetical protein QEM92_000089 [Stenotrophomonas maltophilia]|uniref:hypothetical protein n=1 Tax=Stenotrophomonas maltophilia TaxID=40324 RepID=UPI0012AEF3D3|nr:hypothetical protein [Stenotrophomonas maltophilia]QGM08054.1 hypothetical protein FEO84_01365 [Stenotrophomonas maltophilia]HDS1829515.1 hypothetical protein [Stenotrophomonas maltophilia]